MQENPPGMQFLQSCAGITQKCTLSACPAVVFKVKIKDGKAARQGLVVTQMLSSGEGTGECISLNSGCQSNFDFTSLFDTLPLSLSTDLTPVT